MDLLADLNEAQKKAVTHLDGPLLVLAGAGSGKTRVITRRIARLVAHGVPPWNILAITFTNKAAGEMAHRVAALGVGRGATIGTFHAFAARLLREYADEANIPRNFSIYDTDDQLRCVRQALRELDMDAARFTPSGIHAAISNAKNKLLGPHEYAEQANGVYERTVAQVYAAYQRLLLDNHAMDFDDLLLRMAWLMRDRPDVRAALSRRYRYILIDEYQDTNHAQYVIAHGIAVDHENICVTGDPDQSIYAWRGADITNILEFESDYPNALVVRLEENYRSTAPILAAASRLIARNARRKRKDLIAVRAGGCDVEVVRLADEHAEADEVVEIVRRARDAGWACRDVAVFYRINSLSRVLEESFRKAGVPYQIARGVEFYNRKEIKDVLAYLRLLINPDDDLSCERIINVPSRGIGSVSISRLSAWSAGHRASLLAACSHATDAGLGKAAAAKVAAFAQLMARLMAHLDRSPEEIIEHVVTDTGLEAMFRGSEEERQAMKNVQELISSAADFDREHSGATLADYLQHVSLVSDVDTMDPRAGAVTFMTLHAAKGLEFPVVIMVGNEDGLLPFEREGRSGDIEEERRLAFVGMTRAKDRLVLTSAKYRRLRGQTTRQGQSVFLREIGTDFVQRTDRTDAEPPPRRRPMAVEEFNRTRDAGSGRFYADVHEREQIEAMQEADLIPERFAGLHPGRRVRSDRFGPGTVRRVSFDGARTRAEIHFDRAGRKTLILESAGLEPL